MKECSRVLSLPGDKQLVPKDVIDETDVHGMVRGKDNIAVKMIRPRQEIKASHRCRSPYVSRVIDVNSHVIMTEERNVWKWLFQNKKNRMYVYWIIVSIFLHI